MSKHKHVNQNQEHAEETQPNEDGLLHDESAVSSGDKEHDESERTVKEQKKPYKTYLNDPDLLVKPYKPIEGEPLTIKCPHCGEEMPTTIDTCVNCGHYLKKEEKRYVPMDEKKMKKIRWILGVILVIVFVLIMIFTGKIGASD